MKLATKSPVSHFTRTGDFDAILDEQLKKLQTDHIDLYLFHSLDARRWRDIVLPLGLPERMEAAKKSGKILHIGFSFHDSFAVFREILDYWDKWEFCQIQYNYLDVDRQAGTRGLKYASSKGLPVVVMEPLLGGMRIGNEKIPNLFSESEFVIGRGRLIRSGRDLTVVSTGPVTRAAMDAVAALENKGVRAELIGLPTVYPLDGELILRSARKTGKVVTVEEHYVCGGVGTMTRIAVPLVPAQLMMERRLLY